MPPPATEQGPGPDSQPTTTMLSKLPASGYSLVIDGNALTVAMSKGEWPMLMMSPSNRGELAFDNLLMVFAQRDSVIIPARIGDLRTGKIPGDQFYVRQIYISHRVYEGLTQLHTQLGVTQIQEIYAHLEAWHTGDALAPFTFPVCPRLEIDAIWNSILETVFVSFVWVNSCRKD